METTPFLAMIEQHRSEFHPVIPFDPGTEIFYAFDFTCNNRALTMELIADTERFGHYIQQKIVQHHARYGIGGYGENRILYARSAHFNSAKNADLSDVLEEQTREPRRLHLGTDIWGPVGTPVMCPYEGIVHSTGFNNEPSDYGATMILTHRIDAYSFHTLYGHLSLNSIKDCQQGKRIRTGAVLGEFGMRHENGNWPPHLHFQVILDLQGNQGDYPGVCTFSERAAWLANSPDPELVLQLQPYVIS